jgi:hypothetical protein
VRLPAILLASFIVAAPFTGSGATSDADDANLPIVNRYIEATTAQKAALRGLQMEVNITARLPRLEKQGRLMALRRITRLGKIIYKPLGFSGDSQVKQEVITRYLSAEVEERDDRVTSVVPANYKFHLKATITENGRRTYVFQLTPRKKRVGLFKGELWLDGETGMPLRETGELVKSPSVFLKKVQFTHNNEIRNGVAYPKNIEWKVETRLVGRAELDIEYSNFTKQEQDDEDAVGQGGN